MSLRPRQKLVARRLYRFAPLRHQQSSARSKKTARQYTAVFQIEDRCKPAVSVAHTSPWLCRPHSAPINFQVMRYQFSHGDVLQSFSSWSLLFCCSSFTLMTEVHSARLLFASSSFFPENAECIDSKKFPNGFRGRASGYSRP